MPENVEGTALTERSEAAPGLPAFGEAEVTRRSAEDVRPILSAEALSFITNIFCSAEVQR
jgi:hypothetical protein